MSRIAVSALWVVLAAAVGCSGASEPAGPGPQDPAITGGESGANQTQEPGGDPEADKAARLRAAQESTIGPMCERMTDCAVEDARANMSEKELADLDLENTAPRFTAECRDKYMAGNLSPRQLEVIRGCLAVESDCPTFMSCLEGASPGQ